MVEVNIRNIYKNRGAKSARKIPQIFCTTLRIGSWIKNGSKWSWPKNKPENWSLEEQMKNVPENFK
jgi:hypothetical protein